MSQLEVYNAKLPVPMDEAFVSPYCFAAMYSVALLEQYGFPQEETPLTIVADVNGTEVKGVAIMCC